MNRQPDLYDQVLQQYPSLSELWNHYPRWARGKGKGKKGGKCKWAYIDPPKGKFKKGEDKVKGKFARKGPFKPGAYKGKTGKGKDITCYHCGVKGHKMRDCDNDFSNQHEEDAHEDGAHEDDAHENAHEEDAHEEGAHEEDAHEEDAHEEDAHEEGAGEEEISPSESHDSQRAGTDSEWAHVGDDVDDVIVNEEAVVEEGSADRNENPYLDGYAGVAAVEEGAWASSSEEGDIGWVELHCTVCKQQWSIPRQLYQGLVLAAHCIGCGSKKIQEGLSSGQEAAHLQEAASSHAEPAQAWDEYRGGRGGVGRGKMGVGPSLM